MHNEKLKIPDNPNFASGPVRKIHNWSINELDLSLLGRSHRSKDFMFLAKEVINKTKQLINIPSDYKIILVPGGATGAMEVALWNIVGNNPLDCIVWEVFGELWYKDVQEELQCENITLHKAEFGEYPDISKIDFYKNDVIFTYSGSASGVVFKDEDKIPYKREGLIIGDATTYAFYYNIDWKKVDVVATSWQKVIAGEAAHGVLILSPRAIERLRTYTPKWPIPKLFQIKNQGVLNEGLLDTGYFLNTPSILCFLEAKYNLDWLINKGGCSYINNQVEVNNNIITSWVNKTEWIEFIAKDKSYRSKMIICLKFIDDKWLKLNFNQQKEKLKIFLDFLYYHKVAYDISMHHASPIIGLRIWIGYTIDSEDIVSLTKWLELAYLEMQNNLT